MFRKQVAKPIVKPISYILSSLSELLLGNGNEIKKNKKMMSE